MKPNLLKKSLVPAPVDNLTSMYPQICETFGAKAAVKIRSGKERKAKTNREEQAKYIISLTLTTEQQARTIAPKNPNIAKTKKAP